MMTIVWILLQAFDAVTRLDRLLTIIHTQQSKSIGSKLIQFSEKFFCVCHTPGPPSVDLINRVSNARSDRMKEGRLLEMLIEG